MNRRESRIDIQALRGYAVLVVVLYHAKLSFMPSGYLGVDVFFVISGFLITRLIKDGIERGDFRFSDFYFRRAKRLLPAAYVTLLATTLLAPLFLTTTELNDLRAQIIGAVTFTGNIALWRQTGYFSGAAELKPLLHVWSLAIEEQYYFLLPALLFFCPRRYWMPLIIGILLTSLSLCLLMQQRDLVFFMLPTRAWELMIGSFGAMLVPTLATQRNLRLLFWPALLLVLCVPFIEFSARHPGMPALFTCIATLLLLLRQNSGVNQHPVTRAFGKLGDMSYSLYLVHWPLFAFFNNIWLGKVDNDEPLFIRLCLVLLSLLLAWLLNRYVEEPVRHADIKRTAKVLTRTLLTSLGIILLNVGVAHAVSEARGPSVSRRANYGFSPTCTAGKTFTPLKECRNSEAPNMLVWGDSYAMHLVPLLTSGATPASIVQATRQVCAPLVDTATIQAQAGYSRTWAEDCIAFNQSVLEYLKNSPSIKIVVLSSPIQYMLDPKNELLKLKPDGSYATTPGGVSPAIAGFNATVQAIHALNKQVVVVAPPPVSGFDVGRCHERVHNRLPIMGAAEDCSIDIATYHRVRADVLRLLDTLSKQDQISVVRFDTKLCDEERCRTEIDGVSLYIDRGHLSREGAPYLANYTSLVENIRHSAR